MSDTKTIKGITFHIENGRYILYNCKNDKIADLPDEEAATNKATFIISERERIKEREKIKRNKIEQKTGTQKGASRGKEGN